MSEIKKYPISNISSGFIPEIYLPKGEDHFFYRNQINSQKKYRNLHANEIEILVKNNNFAENWNEIIVTENFNPNLVKNCEFFGRIRIGDFSLTFLEYHDLRLPVGIYNSTVISSDIGDNVVIRNVHYLAHYIIGDNCILFNINEMATSDHAKFGNGILKEGENEDLRIWLEIGNENGGRKILPFDNMITADAFIWSKYRDDKKLMETFIKITENNYDKKRGYYGEVGKNSTIKNCRIIKDVKIGENAYIKGANKLKNLTIHSSKEEPSQIGEGVELVNGIMGFGSKIFYGSKAVRFVIGRNTQVKYGARLLNSVLGDNSTISCCELLNNLIYPFHEQHHNTSFLIATTILGQSNIAAGATIGSNHNSRSPDGEILAGRGFWPGLCTSFKHNSKFASFVLVSKGNYQYEMNIQYPFSLVFLDKECDSVYIMPAYWFMYNMYAMARNNYKFKNRDKRKIIVQNIESEYLAPDSVSEILFAIERLEYLAGLTIPENKEDTPLKKIISSGKNLLTNNKDNNFIINDKDAMKKFGGIIVKPAKAWQMYQKICYYFVVKTLISFYDIGKEINLKKLLENILILYNRKVFIKWWNIGGQIISDKDLNDLKNNIKSGKLSSWDKIHSKYQEFWVKYPEDKARYALYVLEKLSGKKIYDMSDYDWKVIIKNVKNTQEFILKTSIDSRKKDYEDPFRKMNYENESEMTEVLGELKNNDFLNILKEETNNFVNKLNLLLKE